MDLYLEDEASALVGDEHLETEEDQEKLRWKPARFQSYETMALTTTKLNNRVRPCGFKYDGKQRIIKSTCLLSRMKKLNIIR